LRGIRCAASSATTSVVRVASLPHTRSGDCALLLWPLACFCSLFSAHAGPCGPRRPCPTLIQPPAAAFSTCRVPFAGAVYPVRAASARGLSVSFGRPVLFALHVSGFERRVPATGVPAEPRTSRIYEVHGARVRMQIAPIFASSTLFLTLCPRAKTLRTWRTAVAGTAPPLDCCVDFNNMHGLRLSCSDLPSSSAVRTGTTAGAVGVSAHGSAHTSCGTTPVSSGPSTSTSTPSTTPTDEAPACANAFRGRCEACTPHFSARAGSCARSGPRVCNCSPYSRMMLI